ncbi:hypothetical protein OAT16_07420 [Prolixibacteraceae bacterium]|nr:hypothetical protein [Prolixibacteraceae bacterium]
MRITSFHLKDYIGSLEYLSESKAMNIDQPHGLIRESHYLYTHLFPQNIPDIPTCRRLIKEIRDMRYLAPHLILPQRVVSIHPTSFKSKLSSKSFQMFMGDTDDEEAYALRSEKLKDFDTFNFSIFPYATLSTEYRLDWTRCTILLLRQLQALGAKVTVGHDYTDALREEYQDKLGDPLLVSCESIPSPLYVRFDQCVVMLIPKGVDMISIGISGKWNPEYAESLHTLNPSLFNQDLLSLMNSGRGTIPTWELAVMGQSFPLERVKKALNGLTSPSLRLHTKVPSLRELVAQCDRKYDMYKEVNSSRSLMKEYFYRYGEDTDEIAEILYQNLHRLDRSEPKSAWATSEKIFQEEHEFLKS